MAALIRFATDLLSALVPSFVAFRVQLSSKAERVVAIASLGAEKDQAEEEWAAYEATH